MHDTGHSGVAKGYRADKNSIPNLIVLLLLLCLTSLTACVAPSQGASAPTSGTGQIVPAGQLRISPPPAQATVGVAYNAVPSVSGGTAPYIFRIADGSLPPGLVLNNSTGSITGTPSVAGTYNFVIYVWTSPGNEYEASPPFNRSGLSPEVYGSSPAQIVVFASRPGTGLSISPSGVTIASQGQQQFTGQMSGTADTAVTWSASVGTISSSGAFVAPKVTSNTPATITATSTANPSLHATATVTVTPQFALAIANSTLPAGNTGTPYYAALSATGGVTPYQWSLATGTLPSGLQLQSSGTIAGMTALTGSYPFTAKVTDSSGQSATLAFTLTVFSSPANGFDGPAELPRTYIQTAMSNTPAPGSTITVSSGGDLQSRSTAPTVAIRSNCRRAQPSPEFSRSRPRAAMTTIGSLSAPAPTIPCCLRKAPALRPVTRESPRCPAVPLFSVLPRTTFWRSW